MKKFVVNGLLVSGLLCASIAMADAGGTGRFMRYFDTNKDGAVTQAEFEAAMTNRFHTMDTDHNGVVSVTEFSHYIQQRRLEHKQARFKSIDRNGDGQVSKDEYLAYQAKKAETRFARLDKNHDGVLNTDELASRGFRFHHHGNHQRLFHKLDSNGDGVISLEESRKAALAWFARLDSNGDKVVTNKEATAFHHHHVRDTDHR